VTKNISGYDGGGLYADLDCLPSVFNSTFAENYAGNRGGGLYITKNSKLSLIDSILWDNTADINDAQIGIGVGSSMVTASYSDIQGGYTGTGNIDENPDFEGDYYLSDGSPCFDVGSDTASNLGFDNLSTRIDGILDAGQIDLGYHHNPGYFEVVSDSIGVGSRGLIVPLKMRYPASSTVKVTAIPERGYRLLNWTGTDDDGSSSNINYVMMDTDREVTGMFEFAHNRTLFVPGDDSENHYSDLQSAIDVAEDGDVIILNVGTWPWGGFYIKNKVIMITSTSPDNPAVVEATVIDCRQAGDDTGQWTGSGGFYFGRSSGSSILNGITIRGGRGGYGGYSSTDFGEGYDSFYFYYRGQYGRAGGSIYISDRTSPVIANCVIKESGIFGSDGASWASIDLYWNGLPGQNGGIAYGGAIYIGGQSSPTIINCVISDSNVVSGNGGRGGDAGAGGGRGGWPGQAYGGGIYCAAGSTPSIIDCVIENCSAEGGNGGDGGAGWIGGYGGGWSASGNFDYWYGDVFEDTYLTSYYYYWYGYRYLEKNHYVEGELWKHWDYANGPWYYSGHGGGIYIAPGSKPRFVDCTIANNKVDGGQNGIGGASWYVEIADERPRVQWDIPGFGGGVYCAPKSQSEFENCQIIGNSVFVEDVNQPLYTAESNDVVADVNDANGDPIPIALEIPFSGYGGGVCLRGTLETIFSGCVINNNEARTGFGGGVHSISSNLLINDTDLSLNMSKKGGALSSQQGSLWMSECSISENRALIAGEGGGMYLLYTDAEVFDTMIEDNYADWSGGALYISGDPNTSELEMDNLFRNCMIVRNKAGRDGGGIASSWYAEPVFRNCTIADNMVLRGRSFGGGLYSSYGSYVSVIDSIFWDNLSPYKGAQIAVGGGDTALPIPGIVSVTYSDIQLSSDDPNHPQSALDELEAPDFFIYSTFETPHLSGGAYGVEGFVGLDGVDRIIYYNDPNLAYIYTVTIPEGADQHQHPDNSSASGPVAPRTFTLERTFPLGEELLGDLELEEGGVFHESEFFVNEVNNVIFLGASTGIHQYIFNPAAENPTFGGPVGNYEYAGLAAPAAPAENWVQSLAYDMENQIWYAGGSREGVVLSYNATQGPEGIWREAFTYDPLPDGGHHDGMEFRDGYLFLADYASKHIMRFTPDGTLIDLYYNPNMEYGVEGMGFGALDHFWVGSHEHVITEIGGGSIQSLTRNVGSAIYVGPGCTLYGWEPNDPNDFWSWDANSWNSDTNNIAGNPIFTSGYFLGYEDEQGGVSPCIDAGSADISDPMIGLDPCTHTTRTDGFGDC
jgi:hypothetical protein